MELNSNVNLNIAKILNNTVYGDIFSDKYAAEDVEVTWDNYLGTKKYKEGELIVDGDYIHGKYYYAPTYAEVIDWLFYNKNVVIKFEPVFTCALKDNVAYYITVYKVNKENHSLDIIFGDKEFMYSLELAVETILKKVIELD